MNDGEVTKDRSGRYCLSCNREHGFLYACPDYPPHIYREVKELGVKFAEQCADGSIPVTVNDVPQGSWNDYCKKLEEKK